MTCRPAWRSRATFAAVESLEASFDCLVLPPPPVLHTRTGPLAFDAPTCFVALSAAAIWSIVDVCPRAWTPSPRHEHDGEACVCVPVCDGAARFDASALEVALLDC